MMDLNGMDDGDLLQAFTDGNEHAFAELYRRRHLEIYRFILRYMHGDEDAASDMFQETFIKIHENAHTLRNGGTIRSWMFTIARNNCLNYLKHQNRHVHLDEQREDREDESAPQPDEAFEQSSLQKALDDAISRLPDNQREAMILREFEGYSYAEIAEATNTNIGVIRQRLWRAKQSLRTMLADQFYDASAGETE